MLPLPASRIFLLLLPIACGFASGQTLQRRLDERRAEFLKSAPADKIGIYQDGIDAVAASGILEKAKKKGDKAPGFTLRNAKGEDVKLSALLAKGPVVLTWYRGGWCPYCNIALAALQEKTPEFKKHGATLVALTPELPDHSLDTAGKNKLTFEVLSDVGNKVAREYGIVFQMTDGVAKAMRAGAKTHLRNGDESDELPLAATYVIAPDGTIAWAFLDADYRNRAEPDDVVKALGALKSKH
ncbi:MAG: AhpC/TSA family protein [Akkermansiaceae bacterium]|nr:AhpC/TSA family protein [Akkermansiaceae bacterium]MCP5542479.1 AhpC/TSA family protein [Akkermansiaceae bacterium]MCP5545986.1 AhpC/TSA family protein [Akkermansiaceae bacterium]